MMASDTALHALKRQRPEWQPWLAVVEAILRECADPVWTFAVSTEAPARSNAAPLLTNASVALPMRSVHRVWQRLIRVASRTGTPKMATLERVRGADVDVGSLFIAALCQDGDWLHDFAMGCGADAEALPAVAALLPVPFLQAANRRCSSSRRLDWVARYCPVCGAWPAFAEVRGIERNRYLRCGRCGADWHAHALSCPFCATSNHDDLIALVPGKSGSSASVEACTSCHGYVKTLTRLRGCSPDAVMFEDLATVDLDVAALSHGYRRPAGAGYAFTISITDTAAPRRLFSWR